MKEQKIKPSAGCLDIFMAALAIIFITLKLGHIIDWPWYCVLAPIWALIILYVFYIILGVWIIWRKENQKNKRL